MTTENRSTGRKPLTATIATGVALIVVALIAVAYASPYLVVNRLRDAVQARDAQMINRYVDYPALRASLKKATALGEANAPNSSTSIFPAMDFKEPLKLV